MERQQLLRREVFSVSNGSVVVEYPTPLTDEDCRDVLDFLDLVKRKLQRFTEPTVSGFDADEQINRRKRLIENMGSVLEPPNGGV